MAKIPPSLIGTAGPILASAYTHSELNALFLANSFPGDPPDGNKVSKCLDWMRRANRDCDNALDCFGKLIAEFMDSERGTSAPIGWDSPGQESIDPRKTIQEALGKESLSYQRGGYILGGGLSGPSRSLAERLQSEGIEALDREYERAYKAIEEDPLVAVTAACAILESVCKTFLEAKGHELPNKQVLGNLWAETARHLKLQPAQLADTDLKRILQGLYGVADGVAALRTHAGSAHGQSGHSKSEKVTYRIEPRHARLAVRAAHTMAMFVLETWEARRHRGKND